MKQPHTLIVICITVLHVPSQDRQQLMKQAYYWQDRDKDKDNDKDKDMDMDKDYNILRHVMEEWKAFGSSQLVGRQDMRYRNW